MSRNDKKIVFSGAGDTLWLCALIFFIVTVFAWGMNRTTLASFSIPIGYSGDGWLVLANAKAYMDGDVFPIFQKWASHLNAPFTANWNDWPITEELIFAGIGWLGRITGLFLATNILLALCHVLAGVSFWLVGRELQLKREYVFFGAVAYAFSHYIFARNLSMHVVLSTCWHLPWLCLVSWWAFEREPMVLSGRRGRIALIVSVVTGALNPYYMWMYLQFLGFAILKNLLNRDIKRTALLLSFAFITLTVFALFNIDTLSYKWVNGANPESVSRSLSGLELYGLKLPELFLPPSHRWAFLNHFANVNYYSAALIRGEMGSPYLGIAGVVGLIWLLSHGLFHLVRNHPYRVSPAFWQVIWVALYSLIGGVNLILGSFGLVLFRGTNRYSIVILTLALLFLVQALSKSFSGRLARALALMCIPFVLWDQLPLRYSTERLASDSVIFESDRDFSRKLEAGLPNGAMVFQLPVMAYPEVPPIVQMADYEHFRPYLHSENLRYSYGTTKGRGDAGWQAEVSSLPVSEMLIRLEKYGFDAVIINRKGYDDRARPLINALREAGKMVVAENSDLIAFKLSPVHNPIFPAGSRFSSGWSGPETGHRWAISKRANILFYSGVKEVRKREMRFGLNALQSQKVSILFNGKVVEEITLMAGASAVPVSLSFEVVPGANNVTFVTDVTPSPLGNSDPRTLAFSLSSYELN